MPTEAPSSAGAAAGPAAARQARRASQTQFAMGPQAAEMRPAFRRANVVTGLLLGAFVASVYGYSMWAVKQEDFSDVDSTPLPPPTQRDAAAK